MTLPQRPEREQLGIIVRGYFGGLGGLSWEELGPERQEVYNKAGEAVAKHVRAALVNTAEQAERELAGLREVRRLDEGTIHGQQAVIAEQREEIAVERAIARAERDELRALVREALEEQEKLEGLVFGGDEYFAWKEKARAASGEEKP
jgi:hypothetical protein